MAVVESSMNVTIIWYRIAINGGVPARIRPVIIPGSETMPRVFVESIVGTIPVRMESRRISMDAGRISAPKESLASTSFLRLLKLEESCR